MLYETEKWQAEVSAESSRLIKQGVPPWEASMQAGKIVQQRRKLTKRAVDLGWECGICKSSNLESDLLCGFCDSPRPSR